MRPSPNHHAPVRCRGRQGVPPGAVAGPELPGVAGARVKNVACEDGRAGLPRRDRRTVTSSPALHLRPALDREARGVQRRVEWDVYLRGRPVKPGRGITAPDQGARLAFAIGWVVVNPVVHCSQCPNVGRSDVKWAGFTEPPICERLEREHFGWVVGTSRQACAPQHGRRHCGPREHG